MVLEGETFLIIAGMLASLVFDVGDVLWISLGVVLGNTMWYYIGTKLKDSGFAKRIIKWSEKAITFFCRGFERNHLNLFSFKIYLWGESRNGYYVGYPAGALYAFLRQSSIGISTVGRLVFSVGYFLVTRRSI